MVFQGSFMVFGWFPWFFKVVTWFLVGSMVFQGSFMVSRGFWLVLELNPGPTIPI